MCTFAKSPSIPAKYECSWHRTIFTLLNTIGYRCSCKDESFLLRQTASAQGNHNHLSNVDLVVYHRQGPVFLKLHWLRLDSKSNAFIGGHCDTIPHSVRIRRFLRSPRQLPQVALHESLVLNLSSCDYAAAASHWRCSSILDRHLLAFFVLICFDHWKRQLTNADSLKHSLHGKHRRVI